MDDINIVTVCDSISELLWGLKSATTLEFQQNCNIVINSNTVQKKTCKINCLLACYAKKPSLAIDTNKIGSPWHVHCDTVPIAPQHCTVDQRRRQIVVVLTLGDGARFDDGDFHGVSIRHVSLLLSGRWKWIEQHGLQTQSNFGAISGDVSSNIAMHDHSCTGHLWDTNNIIT